MSPAGPAARSRWTRKASIQSLADSPIRRTILAYAGHSWELYVSRAWLAAFLAGLLAAGEVATAEATAQGGKWAALIAGAGTVGVWLGGWLSTTLHHRLGMSVRHLLYAPTDVGPAGISQLCARPQIMRSLPPWLHHRIWKRAVRPAGARWLVSRLEVVPIKLGRSVASVRECCSRLSVRLDDGTERVVDHIMLGTGYKVDISRYKFIAPELLASISRSNGYPRLGDGLETSVPGLHILGAPAACSFGPLMQFVSGTTYVGNALTRFVLQRKS